MSQIWRIVRCLWAWKHNSVITGRKAEIEMSHLFMDVAVLLISMDGPTSRSDSCCCGWRRTSKCCPVSWGSRVRTAQTICWCLHSFPICPGNSEKSAVTYVQVMEKLFSWIIKTTLLFPYQHSFSRVWHQFYIRFQNIIMESRGQESSVQEPLLTTRHQ